MKRYYIEAALYAFGVAIILYFVIAYRYHP